MIGRFGGIIRRTVPRRLRTVRHLIKILQLLKVQLPLPPLREWHEGVPLVIAGAVSSLTTLVGIGHVGKHLQLLVVALQRSAQIELVLLQTTVGQCSFGLRIGVRDTQGLHLIRAGNRHIVRERETCLIEVSHVML